MKLLISVSVSLSHSSCHALFKSTSRSGRGFLKSILDFKRSHTCSIGLRSGELPGQGSLRAPNSSKTFCCSFALSRCAVFHYLYEASTSLASLFLHLLAERKQFWLENHLPGISNVANARACYRADLLISIPIDPALSFTASLEHCWPELQLPTSLLLHLLASSKLLPLFLFLECLIGIPFNALSNCYPRIHFIHPPLTFLNIL